MRQHSRKSAALFVCMLLFAACGTDTERVAGPGELGHIHDLIVDPDGTLLAATHSGLYRVESINRAVLVGTEQHDLMSMATDLDLTIVASGHPDLRLERYRVAEHPPHLGLARSEDGGQTWSIEPEMLGEHDFHALLPTTIGLYAADSAGLVMRKGIDGSWEDRGTLSARDLAANPEDPTKLVATDEDGASWSSDDGARTWTQMDWSPSLLEVEWVSADLIIAASEDGSIWQTATPIGPWTELAFGPIDVETLRIDEDQWWVTTHGGAIHSSTNDGETWVAVYVPPKR